jgi:DNA-binding NarL/FixJ family response regulator
MSEFPGHHRTANAPAHAALSATAVTVLEMISRGHAYEQILQTHPALTYNDIFDAAGEALRALGGPPQQTLKRIRQRHRRAYEKWTSQEENRLRELIGQGSTVARIAGALQRQRSAIRSRIVHLGWVELLSPAE